MRHAAASLAVGLVLLATGCNSFRMGFFNPTKDGAATAPAPPAPTVTQLVEYMNKNAERVKTLRCDDLEVTAQQGIQSVSLDARLVAAQPRNFRMTATFLSKPEVDLGSNQDEFWYWIRRGDPAQIYCRYDDLEAGRVRVMPFPFQPDWVLETMGMGQYGPPTRYELKVEADKLKLIERAKSPQGKPVQKVIVFNRRPVQPPTPQVLEYLLIDDETKQEICSARVNATQLDPTTGGLLPKRMELSWPSQRMTMKLHLASAAANVDIPADFPAFVRRPLNGIPSFNLARGAVDPQPTSIRRASVGN